MKKQVKVAKQTFDIKKSIAEMAQESKDHVDAEMQRISLIEEMNWKNEFIAKELYEKFENEILKQEYYVSGFVIRSLSKQCALIAVDEIINFMKMDDDFNKDCHMANTHWPRFCQSIKKYIENL